MIHNDYSATKQREQNIFFFRILAFLVYRKHYIIIRSENLESNFFNTNFMWDLNNGIYIYYNYSHFMTSEDNIILHIC